jgi:hypothetical protein
MLVRRPVPALLSPVLAAGIRDNHWQRYRAGHFVISQLKQQRKICRGAVVSHTHTVISASLQFIQYLIF